MDDEALGIADVRQMGQEFNVIDKFDAGVAAALDPEPYDSSEPLGQILPGVLVGRVILQPWIGHPCDIGVFLQPPGDLKGVFAVLADPQGQRFDPLQEEEGVEGAEGRSDVSQELDPGLDDIGKFSQRFAVNQAMVAGVRFGELGETSRGPIKITRVHDGAPDGGPMPADELCGRINDDVDPVVERSEKHRAYRVIEDNRQLLLVGYFCDGFEIRDVKFRVPDALQKHSPGPFVDGSSEVLGIRGVHKTNRYPQLCEGVLEQVVGSPVKARGRYDLVPGPGKVENGQGDG